MTEWTEKDASVMEGLLRSQTGQRMMKALKDKIPKRDCSNIEQKAMLASEKDGAEIIIQAIQDLADYQPLQGDAPAHSGNVI